MVMDVAGSYGDWRQPRTPSQQATREQTPVSAQDVNFNSPGHRSSQDGSFIQDEDMQLILEFGAKATSTPSKTAATINACGAQQQPQHIGVLSESWMHRHAKWATDFDANVAELDFDHFSRRDIRTLRKAAAAYQLGKNNMTADDAGDMIWDSFTTAAHDVASSAMGLVGQQVVPSVADCNHNKIRTVRPCNSLDASLAISAGSLFSSTGGGGGTNANLLPSAVDDEEDDDHEHRVAALLDNCPPSAMPAFISTDSLDMSSMAGQEELLRAACTTKKRDYVLTFDRGGAVSESGVGGSDDTDYQDARLSNAVERSLLENDFDATAANVSESFSTGNGEESDGGGGAFVTWGRVKRSYETDHQLPYEAYNATRFTSLPNLNRCSSRNGGRDSTDFLGGGGGERMLSRNGDQCVPIYELKQSTMGADDVSMMAESIDGGIDGNTSGGEGGTSRFSLLKAFKSKLSGNFDRLPLPHFHVADHSSGDSSGYMTGTGSQHNVGGGGVSTKPKVQPRGDAAASEEECEAKPKKTDDDSTASPNGTSMVDDYNYAEFFINGRYIDINHNEIGFVPPSTRGVQRAATSGQQQQYFVNDRNNHDQQGNGDSFTSSVSSPPPELTSFHQQAAKAKVGNGAANNSRPPAKPPRTFATLLRQQQEDEERKNSAAASSNNGGESYVLQQRPERAPYGRRILPKIPDESQINTTEVSRMKDSATQVPVYVVDQSVQTTAGDGEPSTVVATTCATKATVGEPFYVGSGFGGAAAAAGASSSSSSKLADWKKMLLGTSALMNVPDLNFLKFPFNVPQLFPHVAPFPMAFLNDGPDVASFVAQQAKLVNATDDQLAAPKRLLPSPPPPFVPQKILSPNDGLNQLLQHQQHQPLFAQATTKSTVDIGSIAAAAAATLSTPGNRRDSGLGSSNGGGSGGGNGGVGGPSHIQDWESLATLLPKDVLHAYSFFNANTDLLGKSAPIFRPDLNIDKKSLQRGGGCCSCSGSGGRTVGKRAASSRLGQQQQKGRRMGKKQRPLSEPAFKRKQFESIVEEEDKTCGALSSSSSSHGACHCYANIPQPHLHHHHHHPATWCCPSSAAAAAITRRRCSNCSPSTTRKYEKERSPCKQRFSVIDTDDTDEEDEEEMEHRRRQVKENNGSSSWNSKGSKFDSYRPLNQVAKKMGGECSDDERLMPAIKLRHHHLVYSEEDDEEDEEEQEEEEDFCIRRSSPLRGTHSEYHVREINGMMRSKVPKFYSVQNVKEMSQFGYPLKKLRPTQLTCDSAEAALRPCATCYRVRSPSQELSESGSVIVTVEDQAAATATDGEEFFCDCKTSDIIEELRTKKGSCRNCEGTNAKKREKEAIARMIKQKRVLIQGVVAACDMLMKQLNGWQRSEPWQDLSSEQAKAASAIIRYSLCPTMERLVADGLLQGKTVWTVVLASATLGPATKSIYELIYELVTDLDKSVGDNGEHSSHFVAFVNGLLRLRSLDCWLSYLSLKDKILSDNYDDRSFIRKAATTYRGLFDELLGAIQSLSILPFDQLNLDPMSLPSLPIHVTVSRASTDGETSMEAGTGCLRCSTGSLGKNIDAGTGCLCSTVSLHKEIVVTFRKPSDGNDNASSMPTHLDGRNGRYEGADGMRYSLIPTRLPSDSRVPKSSSVPSKMLRHASEPPKSISVDTGLRCGVIVDDNALRVAADNARRSAITTTPVRTTIKAAAPIDRTPSLTRPSRIPVLTSSRSCPEGPRQRSLSNRRLATATATFKAEPVACLASTIGSESAMSVTASTFSEIDAPDTNAYTDSDYRLADARYVYAIDEQQYDRKRNLLAFSKGDTMILLDDKEDGFLRCRRNGEIGLVPRKKVTYVTFL